VDLCTEDGNYIKRKKAAIKVVNVDDSDDDKKPAAATKGEADEDKKLVGNNIDVDIIDDFVVISSPFPQKQVARKVEQPNLSTPAKQWRRRRQGKRRLPFLHQFMCQVNMS
jgi:hypothetical protein